MQEIVLSSQTEAPRTAGQKILKELEASLLVGKRSSSSLANNNNNIRR